MRAKDVMSTPVVTVSPDTRLKGVARVLLERDISAVPVVDDNGELLGIVSEGDLLPLQSVPDPRRRVFLAAHHDARIPTRASDVMSRDVVTLTEDADVTEVARLMLKRSVKRIPVVSGRRVVGIISRRDILKMLARSDESIAAELQQRLDDEVDLIGTFNAEVSDGVATLVGPDEARRIAELVARTIPGITGVRFVP